MVNKLGGTQKKVVVAYFKVLSGICRMRLYVLLRCIAFTNKVESNCHYPAPGKNSFYLRKLILLFLGSGTWIVSGEKNL